MSVPQNYLTVIDGTESTHGRWIEIEGIPYAYGSFARSSDFFSSRASLDRFLGVRSYLLKTPKLLDQKIDTLEGGSKSAGAVSFEVGDVDGSLAQFCGVGYQTGFTALRTEISKSATTIPIPTGGGAAFSNGGYCYIGTETILIGTVGADSFTGCTRGMFRSTPQAFGVGIPIGTRPYTMANRKCWYNQVVAAGQGRAAPASFVDLDRCIRFGGVITNFVMNEPNTFIITVKSMDEELDRQIFRGLRTHKVKVSFMGADPWDEDPKKGGGNLQVPGWPGFFIYTGVSYGNNRDFPCPLTPDGLPLYSPGERILVRIDDEIFLAVSLSNGELEYQMRAMCGTKPEKHDYGAIANELVTVCEYKNVQGFEWSSKFDAVCPTDIHADHPLALVLQVLTSTGLGTNGNYDVLPASWGLGIDAGRVDVFGIERAMQEEPALRFGGVIPQQVNFLQFARELLAFSGYYHYVAIGDEFRIKRLRPPEPDAEDGVRSITASDRLRNRRTLWEANWSGAVREIIFTYGYDILRKDYKIIDIYKSAGGDLYSKGLARTLTYTSSLLYPGKSGIPGEPPFDRFDIRSWLTARGEFFKVRYGRPPPIITEYLNYSFINLEVGDLCIVTNPEIPSTATGAMGMAEEIGEVIGISIDDAYKNVAAQILMTGYQLGDYRYISPTLLVDDFEDYDSSFLQAHFVANAFTDPTGPYGNTQTDARFENSVGDLIDGFGINNHVRVWKADFSDWIDGYITAINFGSRVMNVYFGATLSQLGVAADVFITASIGLGLYITYDEYSAVVGDDWTGAANPDGGTPVSRYGFGADSDDLLDTTYPAHKLFPT